MFFDIENAETGAFVIPDDLSPMFTWVKAMGAPVMSNSWGASEYSYSIASMVGLILVFLFSLTLVVFYLRIFSSFSSCIFCLQFKSFPLFLFFFNIFFVSPIPRFNAKIEEWST